MRFILLHKVIRLFTSSTYSMSNYQDKIYCVVIFMAINNAKLTQINFCQFKNKYMFSIQGQAHGSTFTTRKNYVWQNEWEAVQATLVIRFFAKPHNALCGCVAYYIANGQFLQRNGWLNKLAFVKNYIYPVNMPCHTWRLRTCFVFIIPPDGLQNICYFIFTTFFK